jgi:hypothetical protein
MIDGFSRCKTTHQLSHGLDCFSHNLHDSKLCFRLQSFKKDEYRCLMWKHLELKRTPSVVNKN